jgi:hypothetical protein
MKKIGIVNLSNYTSPVIKEVRNREWVSYGDDNNYYQYLIDRYNGSPTNNAIVNGLSEMIFGKGLNTTDSSRKPNEYAQMVSLFKKDVVRKFCYDLKLMGQCAIQVIYSKDRKKIVQVEHLPIETIRAEKVNADTGNIEGYYYSSDWTKVKQSDKPKRISAFGTSKDPIEILCVKPYRAGYYYYSPVDYQGGLQYAELEEEIANYHLNNIKNGLAPSMLINFNNGIPSDEAREMIEKRIYDKFSGTSSAGKFILSFNDSVETGATIEPVQLSDAHNQYQFLSDESSKKILVSHRIVSPMLFGIKDNTGLGNNADELKTASTLNDNVVVRPFQELLIDHFNKILSFNGITLNLYFETLQPLEFTDLDDITEDKEVIEEETGVKMSKEIPDLDSETSSDWLSHLSDLGEDETLEEWELMDVEDTGDEPEDFDVQRYLNRMKLSAQDDPQGSSDSSLDTERWKVRYKYVLGAKLVDGKKREQKGESRDFCKTMVGLDKIYRKEDIGFMSAQGVNKDFGHKGRNYSIFKYKGGPYCFHRWERRVYKKKLKADGTVWGGNALQGTTFKNVNQAIKEGFKINSQPKEVSIAPIDMENGGHHPDWNK